MSNSYTADEDGGENEYHFLTGIDEDSNPETIVNKQEQVHHVINAVDALGNHRYKTAILEAYVNELSRKELGKKLGCCENNATVTLKRAYKELRSSLC